jgi:multimeric flavodoxin WrbA
MISVVYHSQSGRCAFVAQNVAQGVQTVTECSVFRALDAGVEVWLESEAVLLVGAENSASLAGEFKAFLDRTLYPFYEQETVALAAMLICAGNDGRGAQAQFERIAKGFPLNLMAPTEILLGEPSQNSMAYARDWGQALSEGVKMGIF